MTGIYRIVRVDDRLVRLRGFVGDRSGTSAGSVGSVGSTGLSGVNRINGANRVIGGRPESTGSVGLSRLSRLGRIRSWSTGFVGFSESVVSPEPVDSVGIGRPLPRLLIGRTALIGVLTVIGVPGSSPFPSAGGFSVSSAPSEAGSDGAGVSSVWGCSDSFCASSAGDRLLGDGPVFRRLDPRARQAESP